MNILEYMKDHVLYLDGGMGTLLQDAGLVPGEYPERWNLNHPEIIQKFQREYYEAGSNVVSTNTFGANGLKFEHDELAEAYATEGLSLRPRFSPGYGDLPLEAQESVFKALDCHRKIGLALNDSLLMSPSKSVTAIVGLCLADAQAARGTSCLSCDKADCLFRKSLF